MVDLRANEKRERKQGRCSQSASQLGIVCALFVPAPPKVPCSGINPSRQADPRIPYYLDMHLPRLRNTRQRQHVWLSPAIKIHLSTKQAEEVRLNEMALY